MEQTAEQTAEVVLSAEKVLSAEIVLSADVSATTQLRSSARRAPGGAPPELLPSGVQLTCSFFVHRR